MCPVTASIAIMSSVHGGRELLGAKAISRKHYRNTFIELRCPEYRDPIDGYFKPDPNCNVPLRRIVSGNDEVEAFQREYQVETGDIIAVYTGTTIELRAVIYIVEFCGWKNGIRTAEEAFRALFKVQGAVPGNVQNHYQTCSYGKTLFQADNVAVAVQCHNAPNNWRLGWATPVPGGDLTAVSFTPSTNRRTFNIPASSISDQNMVVVALGSTSIYNKMIPFLNTVDTKGTIPYPKLFLSYRVRNTTWGGYDSGMKSDYDMQVYLHQYNGTVAEFIYDRPLYMNRGGTGFEYTAPFVSYNETTGLGGGLRIKVVSVGGMSATVEADTTTSTLLTFATSIPAASAIKISGASAITTTATAATTASDATSKVAPFTPTITATTIAPSTNATIIAASLAATTSTAAAAPATTTPTTSPT
ncbi:hypothetical protein PLESTB_000853900 [Pleodorina starrii]|uniref:Peptidase M11 gametolysin domain-containing protein n=1 Tax=Pleodorina starrii TaxID=330485 RepID=A0A9W6F3D2_9CHLO|nr:hypothetical protein PLESTB_000853900 [Pleodorina starrii]